MWTWDVENCGPTVQVQGLGMTAVLKEDEERNAAPVVWETRDDDADEWMPMPPDVQEEVERKFRCVVILCGSPSMHAFRFLMSFALGLAERETCTMVRTSPSRKVPVLGLCTSGLRKES